MTDAAPSFEEIKRLIASKKPPLAARLVERRDGAVHREASVVFDGINAWFVDDGHRIELRATEDRVTYVEEGAVERIGPGMVATSNNWVKSAVDGRRTAHLDRATGEVLGPDEILGRACWLVRAHGLKQNAPEASFLLHVDAETGVVMRTAREDADVVLDVEELLLGTATTPSPGGAVDPDPTGG